MCDMILTDGESAIIARRRNWPWPPAPDYTNLEPLPDPMDDLEARVYELEDELKVTRSRLSQEQEARTAADIRATEAEAKIARLREQIRRMDQD